MPRPKLQTDQAVLDAAQSVLFEKGLAAYTLADVARKVGLSRAAILQRFGSKDELLRRIARREVDATRHWLDGLPVEGGRPGLETFLRTIVESMGDGQDFAVRVQLAWAEARDPDLRACAGERYALVQQAIARRVPEGLSLPPREIGEHLHAVIAGATMQWLATDHPNLAAFVMDRLDDALALVFSGR